MAKSTINHNGVRLTEFYNDVEQYFLRIFCEENLLFSLSNKADVSSKWLLGTQKEASVTEKLAFKFDLIKIHLTLTCHVALVAIVLYKQHTE